jgi:uncharacterized protein involved in exopolysaccharide biosynthesis
MWFVKSVAISARSQPRGLAISAMPASPRRENRGEWSRTTMVGLLLPSADMDAEIKDEFVAVRADLRNTDGRVQTLDGRVQALDGRVQALDGRVQRLDASLQEVDARLSAEIRRVETTLRHEIREEGIATRRHFDVVAESLRDDIRIIAEGVIALDAKVQTIRDSG